MVKQIRIYVEGGKSKESIGLMRRGFARFLENVGALAWERDAKLLIVPSGSREDARRKFERARSEHPESFNMLLVDADRPVTDTPRQHLMNGGWSLAGVDDDQVHLMVQAMEAWFIADPEALSGYYEQGFVVSALPRTKNVEAIPKDDLLPALKRATRGTSKGEYHKIRHAVELLARLDAEKVRRRAPHCDRLFQILERRLSP